MENYAKPEIICCYKKLIVNVIYLEIAIRIDPWYRILIIKEIALC